METQMNKWGKDLGLQIPFEILGQLNLHEGSSVLLKIERNCLVVEPLKYTLDELLKGITADNLHHSEFDE